MPKSSRKKKRSKHSSQVRSRKKSRKPKLKKVSRPSLSSSEENESSSYASDSSFSSGEDYRRGRNKRGLRKSRKRARRRSPSSDSESEGLLRVKRRKSSKGKEEYSVRKKAYKKKSRRSPSVSSLSCSTCSESGNSDESDFERSRSRSGRKDKGKRHSEKGKSRTRRDRDRSRSGSLPSLSRDSIGWRSEDSPVAENYPRRLRSVITIAAGDENVDLHEEGVKEEIMYDRGDYPPCRSNDSVDGGNKKDLAIDLQSQKRHVENDDITSSKLGGVEDIDSQDNDYLEGDKDSTSEVASKNVDDLETILRQRALENLLKFRGLKNDDKTCTEKNERSDSNIQHSSPKGSVFIEVKSPKKETVQTICSEVVDSTPLLERDDVFPPPNDDKPKNVSDGGENSDFGMQDPSCTFDQCSSRTNAEINIRAASVISKPKLATEAQWGKNLKSRIRSEQTPVSESNRKGNIVMTQSASNIDNSDSDAAINSTGSTINNNGEEVQIASKSVDPGSSHVEPPSSEPHPNELQDHSKDGSQYEQKTMSVMQGGEMVQVSYKVYIPKKAPALARRKLKR